MRAHRSKVVNIALAKKIIVLGSVIVLIVTVILLNEAGINTNMDLSAVQGIIFKHRSRKHMEERGFDMDSVEFRRQSVEASRSSEDSCGFSHHRLRSSFSLPDPTPMSSHVTINPHYTCLNHGTRYKTFERCICREGWDGDYCDIPNSIYGSIELMKLERALKTRLRLRNSTARNIIYAAPFNHEFDMLEALLHELDDLVEVFIIVESIFTAFGTRKPLRLLPRLHRGYLRNFHHKIMYLSIDHFPIHGRKNGWLSDGYLRSYLGKHGVSNIKNTRDDDVIIVCDMDEIPSRDSIAFLKFHDAYPEPFGFRLRWSAFGFFWKNIRYTQVPAGCTLGMLREVYDYDTNLVRNIESGLNKSRTELREYSSTHPVFMWFMGDNDHYAGWHCSGCFDPEGIRIKFTSAQNGDFPRWGGMHEKMDYSYIKSLIEDGKWFDGSPVSDLPLSNPETDRFFAPSHLLQNFEKYKNILVNPYRDKKKARKFPKREVH